ncbi:hypothetical protein [Persephonella sp.]|uniref:hypothetical protein n=1 Tax=Persephonella sp. TaxID=2060922 RepID=UPI0026370B32|nr:hypothetical protein [Persephonella sp.]
MDRKRAVLGAAFIILSFVFWVLPSVSFPFLDRTGSEYFKESLKTLTITYGVVRALNAGVSVVKDSEIDIAPGGVGATIAAGEILDPVDDLIERFSSILLFSLISLGIQKTVMFMGVKLFFKILGSGLLAVGLYFLTGKNLLLNVGLKIVLFGFIFRFLLPVTAVFSDFTYNSFFKEDVLQSKKNISYVVELLKTEEVSENQEEGIVEKLKGIQKSFQIEKKIKIIKDYSSKLIESIITLATAFVFQSVLIPVFVLWVFIKSLYWIFRL